MILPAGAISAFICLIQIMMHYVANEMAEKSAVLMGSLLVVLWAFGAGFNTRCEYWQWLQRVAEQV
jgi:hypothetical protein